MRRLRRETEATPLRQLLPAAVQELAAVLHLARAREVQPETREGDGRAHAAERVLDAAVVRVVQGARREGEHGGREADHVDLAVKAELLLFLALRAVFQVLQLVIEEEVQLRPKVVERRLRGLSLEGEAGREKGPLLGLPGTRAARDQESGDQEPCDPPGGQFNTSGRSSGVEAGFGPKAPSRSAAPRNSPDPALGTRAASPSRSRPASPRRCSARTSAGCGRREGTSSTAPAP